MSCCENNSRNGFIFNNTNGTYNNNNKFNSNYGLAWSEFGYETARLETYTYPYHRLLQSYYEARRGKRGKIRRLKYDFMYQFSLARLTHALNNYEYIPRYTERFVVDERRKPREIISSHVEDCTIYQLWGDVLEPIFSREIPSNSYSCQKGKGGLKMMQDIYDMVYEVSEGYSVPCDVFIMDFQRCFMSIDRAQATDEVNALIRRSIKDNAECELMQYMTRIVFESCPDETCKDIGRPERMAKIPEKKRMRNAERGRGFALGKWPSQLYINYHTAKYMRFMQETGFRCGIYTDDTIGVIRREDRYRLTAYRPIIADYVEKELHLTMHPDKFFLQPYERGFRCLGYRIRKDIVLPNKTIAYNMQFKVSQYIKAAHNEAYVRNNAERFMAVVNSYMGFLKWAYTAQLRRKALNTIRHSAWGSIFDIRKDLSAITIKAECKPIARRIKRNKEMRQVIRNTWHR